MSGKSQGILKWTIGGNPDTCSIDVEMFLWFSYQWFASLLAANFKREKYLKYQGPVVQSIVSLTSSLRGQLVKCYTTL